MAFRGWGRSLRQAAGNWYNDKSIDRLTYQVLKYRQRDGWSHRDVLRLSHPRPSTEEHNALYHWITQGEFSGTNNLLEGYLIAQGTQSEKEIVALIQQHNLTREMIPTEFLKSPKVWEALLVKMPLTAMIRNLGNMSKVGLLVAGNWDAINTVTERLENEEYLHKARIHPLGVLAAMNTYSQGHGFRGKSTWNPVSQVVDALDSAFYKSFGNVEPTGKNIVLALDISGSMTWGNIAGVGGITPRMGSAAMAMVIARVDRNIMLGFSRGIIPLKISPRQRLDDIVSYINGLPFGGTDCAMPMLWAIENKCKDIDAFIILTDNETWAGRIHPCQALDEYRRKFNPNARLVVVGMTSTGFSIADPKDNKALDVVGFDTAAPNVISSFVRGEF